jgi:D-ribose pyranose/furanose isomerase RbsD
MNKKLIKLYAVGISSIALIIVIVLNSVDFKSLLNKAEEEVKVKVEEVKKEVEEKVENKVEEIKDELEKKGKELELKFKHKLKEFRAQ